MTLYRFLLLLHVSSAILGLGPGFILIYIVKKASSMTELRHAYSIRKTLHIFVMVGGTVLLLSGLAMGALNPYLFQAGWYVTALILFLIALAFGPVLLSPKSKPIKVLLKSNTDDKIPPEYYELARKLFFYERIENVIFFTIIVLMVLKPF